MFKLTAYWGPVIEEHTVLEVTDKSVKLLDGRMERRETTYHWWFHNREEARVKAREIYKRRLEGAEIQLRSAQELLEKAQAL